MCACVWVGVAVGVHVCGREQLAHCFLLLFWDFSGGQGLKQVSPSMEYPGVYIKKIVLFSLQYNFKSCGQFVSFPIILHLHSPLYRPLLCSLVKFFLRRAWKWSCLLNNQRKRSFRVLTVFFSIIIMPYVKIVDHNATLSGWEWSYKYYTGCPINKHTVQG